MNLKEVFDQLTYGELSQLSIGGNEAGAISEANYPRVVPHINMALTALYKRFPLKEGRLVLQLQSGVTTYSVNSRFAASNTGSTEPVKYILDSAGAPFSNDIHKIERVYTDSNYELSLNDNANPYSVFTPSALVLRVPSILVSGSMEIPEELKTSNLELVYRANHPKIDIGYGFFEPELVDLELPDSHLEPLLFYVASRLHTPTGMTNETNMGNTYFAKYEASCQQIEISNLRVDQGSQNTGIQRNGWV